MKFITHIFSVLAVIALCASCQSDNLSEQIYEVEIYLTDDPLNAEEVNVEILSVVLKGEGESEIIELNTISGIYNLLDFQGDVDTLIASGNYDLSTIKEIRLILGENNTIKIDGVTYPLKIPSGASSGLKIKIDKDLIGQSLVSLLIDFDACESVKEQNGEYKLSPVIHFKGDRNVKSLDLDYVTKLDSCYEIIFPVDVKDLDGEVVEVTSAEELRSLMQDELITGVVYPIEVVDENGNTNKVNNHKIAEKLIDECEDEEEEEFDYIDLEDWLSEIDSCYSIEYPLSVVLDDGNTRDVNSNEELVMIENAVEILFPIYLIDGDETKKINNENQLEAQLKNCEEEEEEEETYDNFQELLDKILECYDITFPVSVIMEDSTQMEAIDLDQLKGLADGGMVTGFVYDFTITGVNGASHLIKNSNQLKGLLNQCKSNDTDGELLLKVLTCYQLEFPIKVKNDSGETVMIDNIEALQSLIDSGTSFEIKFPINLLDSDGNDIKISNRNKLQSKAEEC